MIRLALLLLAAIGASIAIAQTIPTGMDPNGVFNGMNARNAAWGAKADLSAEAVSCPAGTVSLTTLTVVGGFVTHC